MEEESRECDINLCQSILVHVLILQECHSFFATFYATPTAFTQLKTGKVNIAVTFRSVWGSEIWTPTVIFAHSGGFLKQ